MSRAVVALAVCACSARPPPDPTPQNRVDVGNPDRLAAEAERELERSTALDYDRPFRAYDPTPVGKRYLDACRAGHHPSCWIARSFGGRDVADTLVRRNCLAHDAMSCRALPADDTGDTAVPGWAGRASGCAKGAGDRCDEAGLRSECDAGFPVSCHALVLFKPERYFSTVLPRIADLARVGCRAGIRAECDVLAITRPETGGEADLALAREQGCRLARQCAALGNDELERGDLARARDLFERECQLSPESAVSCVQLGKLYVAGKLAEPVPGRGRKLIEWGCAKTEALNKLEPVCKHR